MYGSVIGFASLMLVFAGCAMKTDIIAAENRQTQMAEIEQQLSDESIKELRLDLETMLVAANTFIHIPDNIFHRRAKGVRLLGKIKIHPAHAKTPDGFKAEVQQALKNSQEGDS